jgi:hypothetical protein
LAKKRKQYDLSYKQGNLQNHRPTDEELLAWEDDFKIDQMTGYK